MKETLFHYKLIKSLLINNIENQRDALLLFYVLLNSVNDFPACYWFITLVPKCPLGEVIDKWLMAKNKMEAYDT